MKLSEIFNKVLETEDNFGYRAGNLKTRMYREGLLGKNMY